MKKCAVVFLSLTACAGSADELEPISFEEFEAQADRDPDTGMYVINGDVAVEDIDGLWTEYQDFLRSIDEVNDDGVGRTQQPAIVNVVNGQWDRWSPQQAQNITYCISQKAFGSRHSTVISAMNSAAGAWESAGNLDFVHASAYDGDCTARTPVTFHVTQVCRGRYLASAFFPSYSRRNRTLNIDCTSFGNISPWTLTGVLRHELGHTIGLRHEHTRPESGVCQEANNWAPLTAYDSDSVMHYPQCNGTNDGDLVLTSSDRTGAGLLYP